METRHLQYFWDASGDFWQTRWNNICAFYGYDKYAQGMWGTFLLTFVVYWSAGLCYTFIDTTGKPSFLLRYKIQDNPQYPIPVGQVWKAMRRVLINYTFVGIPYLMCWYYFMTWRGYNSDVTLPTFQRALLELIFFMAVEEPCFYYSHRLLHHPRLYRHIYRQHHEWTCPTAIAAFDCHPVDFGFSFLPSILIGPVVLGSHMAVAWLWFSIALLSTLNTHSGFRFPFLPSPEYHNFHHLRPNQNFGTFGIMDRLHGTDILFRNNTAYRSGYTVLLNLLPIKQLHPDNPKLQ